VSDDASNPPCVALGCDDPRWGGTMFCRHHYRQLWRHSQHSGRGELVPPDADWCEHCADRGAGHPAEESA